MKCLKSSSGRKKSYRSERNPVPHKERVLEKE
jgi:hypothetical protein